MRRLMCMVMGVAFMLPTASADVWMEDDFDNDGKNDFISVIFEQQDGLEKPAEALVSLQFTEKDVTEALRIPVPVLIDPETGQPDSALEVTLSNLPGAYFKEELKIFKLDFQPQACGVAGGASYFFFANGKLIPGFNTERISDAGVFHVEDHVDFRPDGVEVKITTLTEWDDEKSDYTREETTIRLYRWNGQALRLLSEESKSSL